jgi:hypothetical protein
LNLLKQEMETSTLSLSANQIEDFRLASSKMQGAKRRSFLAEIALKYCNGSARKTESLFGWGRDVVNTGLGEKRTGIICIGAQSSRGGNTRWEERHPQVAEMLYQLAESHAQQDNSFLTEVAFTRLTAAEALKQLRKLGVSDKQLPAAGTMAKVLNRLGFRLRAVVKSKPQKKFQKLMRSSIISRKKRSP